MMKMKMMTMMKNKKKEEDENDEEQKKEDDEEQKKEKEVMKEIIESVCDITEWFWITKLEKLGQLKATKKELDGDNDEDDGENDHKQLDTDQLTDAINKLSLETQTPL
eukprot:810004_1